VHLVDTVRIDKEKATLLTEGVKSTRDTLFFLTPPDEEERKTARDTKVNAAKRAANGNLSPAKNKTVGGKVLRNKTRSAAQEEVIQSVVAKMAEHQKELHGRLQEEGLAKYSEEDEGNSGKEGKGWKKFQSYKGEGALPQEVESLRVRFLMPRSQRKLYFTITVFGCRYMSIARLKPSFCPFTASPCRSISTPSRMQVRTTRVILHICGLTSKLLVNWRARRRIRWGSHFASSFNPAMFTAFLS
jgi:hypothetical protein